MKSIPVCSIILPEKILGEEEGDDNTGNKI
jgi:hypothetical protein